MTEYLYLNIKTGAYYTVTRNGIRNPESWEKPAQPLTVFSCCPDVGFAGFFRLVYYDAFVIPGWMLVSPIHGGRFRAMGIRGFYQPIDLNDRSDVIIIEPLDGTRMPKPNEVLHIIPTNANA